MSEEELRQRLAQAMRRYNGRLPPDIIPTPGSFDYQLADVALSVIKEAGWSPPMSEADQERLEYMRLKEAGW